MSRHSATAAARVRFIESEDSIGDCTYKKRPGAAVPRRARQPESNGNFVTSYFFSIAFRSSARCMRICSTCAGSSVSFDPDPTIIRSIASMWLMGLLSCPARADCAALSPAGLLRGAGSGSGDELLGEALGDALLDGELLGDG